MDLIKNLATNYEADLTLGHEEMNVVIIMLTNDGKLLIFNSIKNDKTFHLNHRD
jgi:hypothetical protein